MIASKINVRRLTFDLKRGLQLAWNDETNRMIPRSMPKCAIITEIECANFGKIKKNEWFFKASYGANYARLPLVIVTVRWRLSNQTFWRLFQLSMSYRFGDMLRKNLVLWWRTRRWWMNNPDENSKIVKGRISVVLQGRDLNFWERSEKNTILRKRNFRPNGRSWEKIMRAGSLNWVNGSSESFLCREH